jgi:hypothetical protein
MDDLNVLVTIKSFSDESRYKKYSTIWPCIVIKEALARRGVRSTIIQDTKIGIRADYSAKPPQLLYYWLLINDELNQKAIKYDICYDFYEIHDSDSDIFNAYLTNGLDKIIDRGPRWCTINLITLTAYDKLYIECSVAELAPLY